MPATLRPSYDSDLSWVWELKKLTLRDYVEESYGEWDDEVQYDHFVRHFSPAQIQIVVAQGRDVGFLQTERFKEGIYLANIGLLPSWQRRGIGSALIRDLLAEGGAKNIPVNLQVLLANPARQLYERLGFKVYAETPTHFLMRWKPSAAAV